MSTLTFTRSHILYRTRWCDPFELNTSDGAGWMLLDLPGAPCNVTQPGMRTMSQRLRKAQECAEAGGKYGLMQAVLLSLDSQPTTPAQWVREAVALEACSRVLLPEAHNLPLDLDAARGAYQRLMPAEQRLWRQLQAARTQLLHGYHENLDMLRHVKGYQPNDVYTANVLGAVTEDPYLFAHEIIRSIIWACRWGLVVTLSRRYGLVGNSATPVSMQVAYNWALASYHQHGRKHHETKAALAAAKEADPDAWVPKLMAGLAYPSLSLAPESAPGGFVEAMGYARHFGELWALSGSSAQERAGTPLGEAYASYSAPLKWLLSKRGLVIPTPQQQRDVCSLRWLTCGNPVTALQSQALTLKEVIDLCDGGHWASNREQFEQRGFARLLRALVVGVACWAAVTMNMPPVSAAPRLWEGLGVKLGLPRLDLVGIGLDSMSGWGIPNAIDMIRHCSTTVAAHGAAAAAALGFWNPLEIDCFDSMVPSLTVAAARWRWQRRDPDGAQRMCQMEQAGPLRWLRDAVAHPTPEWLLLMANGVAPASVQPIDDMLEFVAQERLHMPAVSSDPMEAHKVGEAQGAAAARAVIARQGDRQEQRLYGLFPGWLDQLVSQVTGRQVTLVVEPPSAHNNYEIGGWPRCSVFLKDATSGQQQLFFWRQPGDADCEVAHKVQIEQAVSRGCRSQDLGWSCAAMEPFAGAPAAGGGSSTSASTSGRQHRLAVQGRSAAPPPAAGTASAMSPASTAAHTASAKQGGSITTPSAATAAAGGAGSSDAAAVARSVASMSLEAGGVHTGQRQGSSSGSSSHHSSRVKPSRPCAQCGELFPKLKQCSRCKAVAYCSRDCQVAHWKAGHKEACQERAAG